MSADAARHVFTVAEYDEMVRAEVFDPDLRLELLDGEVLDMTPIGPRNAGKVARLSEFLNRQLGQSAIVWVQSPVELSPVSEPQPDLALLRRRPDYYEGAHPVPEDLLLVIEVSDTSIYRDRTSKRRLYAAAGIEELWVIDLADGVIEVATGPSPTGYENIRVVRTGDPLAPTAFPTVTVPTDDLLR